MNGWPLWIATGAYVLTAIELSVIKDNQPLALTFAAYAVANFGLMWAAFRG
jgi:hypothetical protein